MKKLILIIISIFFLHVLKAQVTGTAFLQGQTDHSNIKVKFIASSPTAKTDSTLTNSDGSYSKSIQGGIYLVEFSKAGFQKLFYNNTAIAITTNQVLSSITLTAGNVVDVSGNVSGLWLKNNIYLVKGDLTILTGQALTIQPGTIIKFDGNYTFNVSGDLIAAGQENDTIVLTSNKSNPNDEEWAGIILSGSITSKTTFRYCKLEYATRPLSIQQTSSGIQISNCNIRRFKEFGIISTNNTIHTITGNVLKDFGSLPNTATAIAITSGSSIISCNKIFNGLDHGIMTNFANCKIINNELYNIHYILAYTGAIKINGGSPLIQNNYIHNCSIGISSGSNYESEPDGLILNNLISKCEVGLLFFGEYGSGIVKNNMIIHDSIGIKVDSYNGYIGPREISYNLIYSNKSNFVSVEINAIGQIVATNSKGFPVDGYYNLYSDPLFINDKPPFLLSNSPSIGSGENGSNIGADISQFCDLAVPCELVSSLLTKPTITVVNNNLVASISYSNALCQWQLNNQDEVGQASTTHTNRLLNTEYKLKATINGCPSVYSNTVSVFKNISVTTVTITEVITLANCNFDKNLRVNQKSASTHEPILTIDSALNQIQLSGNEANVKQWDVEDNNQKKLTTLPAVATIEFQNLEPGLYYFKPKNAEGNVLKIFKLLIN